MYQRACTIDSLLCNLWRLSAVCAVWNWTIKRAHPDETKISSMAGAHNTFLSCLNFETFIRSNSKWWSGSRSVIDIVPVMPSQLEPILTMAAGCRVVCNHGALLIDTPTKWERNMSVLGQKRRRRSSWTLSQELFYCNYQINLRAQTQCMAISSLQPCIWWTCMDGQERSLHSVVPSHFLGGVHQALSYDDQCAAGVQDA
jgi:hypothetical protein